MEEANRSEIAALRGRIRAQNLAAQAALTSFAQGSAQHAFIKRRYQKMDEYLRKLAELVGEDEAIKIVIEVIDEQPAPRKQQEGA